MKRHVRISLWILCGSLLVNSITMQSDVPGIFLNFGEHNGDVTLRRTDDGFSEPINITSNFTFFASSYSTLFVSVGILFTLYM